MKRALCIEDDATTAEEIVTELRRADFQVDHTADGQAGLALALGGQYDVITLDRMLPSLDGMAIVAGLRQAGLNTPVLMISALATLDDRVQGLRAGGDDYLVKPFASEEMAVRVEALLRRHAHDERKTQLQFKDLCLDLLERRMSCSQRHFDLQGTEFKLLEFLMRNAGQVVTRGLIFETVWGYNFDPGTKLIDVHLTRLRRKLVDLQCEPTIRTIRGSGFVLDAGE
ncbi:response regulator transcription factor [Pseudomonas putida]|uniref:response regulator transcription factor n=1 Tax=Pseudomonas TaxID=286 RepID=UPI000D36D16C|nr:MULTISPECIES: response regulator transcription factor [Pseudomonas]EKT4475219.1 response regulator transcription factor [Pseudomonas putida]MCX2708199.1 response regulator transcription factor [Pseudomonas sp. DCB_BG]MDD2140827.1 response regulator transcription factor [Pseudomonas putida]PTV59940.1 DNA-binding response regulator [Pseudomonas putida]HDS1725033.1 response regulator transcription factor [Pseudomonas putida]